MNAKIKILTALLAVLTLSACQSLPSGSGPSAAPAGARLTGETVTLEAPRLGREVEGYTCPARSTLVCTDNGFWSRCRCTQ